MEANIKDYFDFIIERQIIWYKRFILKQESPWTNDPILQKYKILNVYRELDKGTQYIIKKLKYFNKEKILINIIFYRFFNLYNLYETLKIEPFNELDDNLKDYLIKKMSSIKNSGKPIFSDAYLISTNKKDESKHITVLNIISKINIPELLKKVNVNNPEKAFKAIKSTSLVGPFLAYEIFTDLTYFDFPWNDNDFVNIGPGALWGLEILFGKTKNQLTNLSHLYNVQKDYLKKEWFKIHYEGYSNNPYLSLRNIEHSLCEFRKYWNLRHGKGKKRYYKML